MDKRTNMRCLRNLEERVRLQSWGVKFMERIHRCVPSRSNPSISAPTRFHDFRNVSFVLGILRRVEDLLQAGKGSLNVFGNF